MQSELDKVLDKDAEDSGWVKCPYCGGCGSTNSKVGTGTGNIVCWNCHGTGYIPKTNQIQDLIFEAFASDSTHLRQKCIWEYTFLELQKAVLNQIKGFEDSISDGKEEDYIIEEYKDNLERFKEWSRYFLLDAQSLRTNSTDPSVLYQGV